MENKALNLFISYSHEDEEHFKNFNKHLITLKRNGIIKELSDVMLTPGDDVDSELDKMIEESDLIVFLISVDFLNSKYCYDNELKQALERLEDGSIRIIPVVVKQCRWKDSVLGSYLSATKNGNPVSKYEDENDAWCEVIDSIEKAHTKFHEKKSLKNTKKIQLELTEKTISYLDSTEIVFNHRFKEKVCLSDIFVSPILKHASQDIDVIESNIDSIDIINRKKVYDKILIVGNDQSGKTALAKVIYKSLYDNGFLPIYIKSEDITKADIGSIVKKEFDIQYISGDESYFDFDQKKVIILDDFKNIKLNEKFQNNLLRNIESDFDEIIIFSDDSIRYNESQYVELSAYDQFDILPLNNSKRGDLISKWNSLGQEETIDITYLHNKNDDTTYKIDGIIRKNILPSKPIYVLSVIQTLDTARAGDYSLTSYGYCYQSIIQNNLYSSNIRPDELDQFMNYLSEIAYYIFKSNKLFISEEEFFDFKEQYSKKYVIQSHGYVIDALLKSEILKISNDKYIFSYKYIYYFYVAKYISEHLDDEQCKLDVENLCEYIHTETNSNIIIFLVHHSKDQIIIDEILLHASVIFDQYSPANLRKNETEYLENFVSSLPSLVIKQKNIEKQREQRLLSKDIEDSSYSSDSGTIEHDFSDDSTKKSHESDSDSDKVLADVNSSVRITEIVGQILRNRHGSLTKDQLKDLTLTAYNSGLKFLTFFIEESDRNQDQIIKVIKEIILNNTDISDEDVTKEARNFFLYICYTTIYSVINKITNSIGTPKLMSVFEEIKLETEDSPAIDLLLIAIHLEFYKKIPKKEIELFYSNNKNSEINKRLLKEIVIQHLHLNIVKYPEMQWISDKLNLPIEKQRQLQGKLHNSKVLKYSA